MSAPAPHPMQPIAIAADGIVRFKCNAIVLDLADSLNDIARFVALGTYSVEDAEQFWQLLGHSVSAYGELPFVRPETVAAADEIAAKVWEERKR